jgi:nucleoside-diphosphate-sugar epimerase
MIETTLITGGTGFIGNWLGKGLRLSHAAYDSSSWRNSRWKNIIHLAPVPVDDVIQCARCSNARILFASSGGVYDREPSDYFRMKIEDEQKLAESGLDYRIARIFTTCGAGMTWERYAIGNFIKQAEQGVINVQSYGLVVRSYMYGSDLAEWLWAILLHGQRGGIYNVGADVPHSTYELAFEIASHFDPAPQINKIQRMENEPRPFYVPDTTRAREELGLTIKVPFEEAVAKTVEDYRWQASVK